VGGWGASAPGSGPEPAPARAGDTRTDADGPPRRGSVPGARSSVQPSTRARRGHRGFRAQVEGGIGRRREHPALGGRLELEPLDDRGRRRGRGSAQARERAPRPRAMERRQVRGRKVRARKGGQQHRLGSLDARTPEDGARLRSRSGIRGATAVGPHPFVRAAATVVAASRLGRRGFDPVYPRGSLARRPAQDRDAPQHAERDQWNEG